MVLSAHLSDAQVIVLAIRFVTEANFTQLELLAAGQTHILTPSLLYQQLYTYLPADTECIPGLVSFLANVESGFKNVSSLDEAFEESGLQEISATEANRQLHEIRINTDVKSDDFDYDDDLSAFIIRWIHRVDSTAGTPPSVLELLEPFTPQRPKLALWCDTYLIPLIKLQNDFYPGRAEDFSVRAIERLGGISGVRTLLQFAEQEGEKAQIGRDLDEVVTPWVSGASRTKRRRLSQTTSIDQVTSWSNVNEWIYTTSHRNLSLAAQSFLEWSGPQDEVDSASPEFEKVRTSHVQTGIAILVTSTDVGDNINLLLRRLLAHAASVAATIPTAPKGSGHRVLSSASRADLLENVVLRTDNPITRPSEEVFNFLDSCLSAQEILETFKISLPAVAILDTALFGSEERQKQELLRILQQVPRLTNTHVDWLQVRQQLYKLHSNKDGSSTTEQSEPSPYPYLGRVASSYLESEFLSLLIANGQYSTAKNLYLDSPNPPLGRDLVHQHIVSAVYTAYDNASNGNRTRGGMKRAYEILKAFQSSYSTDPIFIQIDHLIRATHSLSFYHLTLQHGVPFKPATVRVHHDPVSLIEKVLAQNQKAFTKLDDLIEIGNNLVQAGLPNSSDLSYASKSLDERLFDVRHRITYLAITSALADHDFDTAYSYITTRLATSPSQTSDSSFTDDTSWRAAYAAGKYRPAAQPKSLHDRITGLSKRMDLLSLALTLTPTPESLSEILATWRRCEEELDSLKSQAVEEERAFGHQSSGQSTLPGGFANDRDIDVAETRRMMERRALGGSGPSYEEDAPMGLFDVARGAASALRKSAFPLRGSGRQPSIRDHVASDSESGVESLDERRQSGEHQRVRKRDMVSNMVTGGLVSGMSWVLGTQPVQSKEER